jgi:hypothetical protein
MKIRSAMRLQALPCALLAIVVGLAAGCGGSTTTSSTSSDPGVTAAKNDLRLTYRGAEKARLHGLRCSVSSSPGCHHPRWFPPDGVLVSEVGSELLERLKVGLVASPDQVVRSDVTYILGDKTRRKSIALAHMIDGGTVLVLHGSPSGASFTRLPSGD